jgi:hypothetical protein
MINRGDRTLFSDIGDNYSDININDISEEEINKDAIVEAIENGYLARLKSIKKSKNKKLSVWERYLYFDDFDIMELCYYASCGGHLDCLKFLHETGCPWDGGVILLAIRHDRIDCLRYILEEGYFGMVNFLDPSLHEFPYFVVSDPVTYLCDVATSFGKLDCLKWLHESWGCKFGSGTMAIAVAKHQLECIVYLHEKGCEWCRTDVYTGIYNCYRTMYNDDKDEQKKYLECVMYLIENGCPFFEISIQAFNHIGSYSVSIPPITSPIPMFLNYKRYREWVMRYFPDHDELPEISKRMYNTIIEEDTGKEELEIFFIKDMANSIIDCIKFV